MESGFSLSISEFGRFVRPFGQARGAQYNRISHSSDGLISMAGAGYGTKLRYRGANSSRLHYTGAQNTGHAPSWCKETLAGARRLVGNQLFMVTPPLAQIVHFRA
jgi:hypothetical protein